MHSNTCARCTRIYETEEWSPPWLCQACIRVNPWSDFEPVGLTWVTS